MFEVGKKVVCIKTHSQKAVIEDKIYTIFGLKPCTNCKELRVDVGIPTLRDGLCSCGTPHKQNGVHWISAKLFRPLDDKFATSVLENILKQIREEQLIETI
jgi:hypothetical protein